MFAQSFQVYPMGFQTPLSEGVKSPTEPDAEIVRLWNDYRTGRALLMSHSFRRDVIRAVQRLYGYFPEWLDAQDKNTKISQSAYEMIEDTVCLINTGRRPIELSVRLSIIATEQQMNMYQNPCAVERTSKLRDSLQVPTNEVIFRWITGSTDGFFDMLCTTHAIFGLTPRG